MKATGSRMNKVLAEKIAELGSSVRYRRSMEEKI